MAADEEKTKIDASGKEDKESGETQKKKGGNKLFLFGGIGVGAIVIGIVLAMFVVKQVGS